MTYAIVYSSKTGNTRRLAETIRDALPAESCLYFGAPDDAALAADRIYVGFWTDKGTCDADTAAFLSRLTGQQVFLFGTAGFGGAPEYFDKILSAAQQHLPGCVAVCGSYMCQGKMPPAVRTRYEQMEDSPRRQLMLDNFDAALSHPDENDLTRLRDAVCMC